MSTQDIVRTHVHAHHGEKANWEAVYVQLHKLLEDPKYRMFRAGNTLCMYYNNGNKTAMIYMFNADPVGKVVGNMKEGFAAFKKAGFKELYTNTQRTAIVKLIEKTGYTSVTYRGTEPGDDGKPIYFIHIEL